MLRCFGKFGDVGCLMIPCWRLVRQDCGGVAAAEAASQLVRTILNSNLPDWHDCFLLLSRQRTREVLKSHYG